MTYCKSRCATTATTATARGAVPSLKIGVRLETALLGAMRDPRNWVRPAAAVVVGAGAGSALVLLRVRNRHCARRQQSGSLLELTERTLADIAAEARRILPRR